MRTRSSKSYNVGPRDIYEQAGYGLLDTIEQSFYLDDGETDLSEEEEDVNTGLISLSSNEEETVSIQRPRSKRLIVKLRIPGRNATPTLSNELEKKSLRDEKGRIVTPRATGTSNELTMKEERPRLMVVLRMPRPAGQVRALAEELVIAAELKHMPDAVAEVALTSAAEESRAELEHRLPEKAESILKIDTGIKDHDVLPANVIDIQIEKDDVVPEDQRGIQELSTQQVEEPVRISMEVDDQIAGRTELVGEDSVQTRNEEDVRIQEHRKVEDQVECGLIIEADIEEQAPTPNEPLAEENLQDCTQGEVTPERQHEVKERVEPAKSEDGVDIHHDQLLVIEAQRQHESQPDSFQVSERGSSSGNRTPSSSHTDEDAWPAKKALDEATVSLLPSPLTMPSPELPNSHLATPPRDTSQPPQPTKISFPGEPSQPSLPTELPLSPRHTKSSLPRELSLSPQHTKSCLPQEPSPLPQPAMRSMPHAEKMSPHSKRSFPLAEDAPPKSKKQNHGLVGDAPPHSKKRKLVLEDPPPQSKERVLPLTDTQPRSKKRNPPVQEDALPRQPKKRSLPLDDDTPEADTHISKKQRRREKEQAKQANINMQELKEATRGTGVLEAGRMAQQRRGILPNIDQVASGRVHKPKRPEKKPPSVSGRQKLLESRIQSSSQRLRGGNKIRNMVRPSAKGKRNS